MRKIEVCFSPQLIDLHNLQNKVVVIVDILRATSTMVAGLGSGVASIIPVANVEDCDPYRKKGYLAAGERNGKQIDGFDLGNSPYDFMQQSVANKKITMTTTNGTWAILNSMGAEKVIIGAFLNLSALVEYLLSCKNDLIIHCAGWKGMFNLEDSLFAGALAERLAGEFSLEDDASMAAVQLYSSIGDDINKYLQNSSHVRRLDSLSMAKDVEFCLQKDRFSNVPRVNKESLEISNS